MTPEKRFFPAAAKLAVAMFVAAGCAAALQANKRSPGTMVNGEFKPQRPPAAAYGPDKTLTCPEFGPNGALNAELGEKKTKAQPDGRLCAIADTLLGWKSENKSDLPSEGLRAFVSQYFGLPGTVRNLVISDLETEDAKMIASALADPVATFAADAHHPVYGMMTERVKKGLTHVVLVLFDDQLQLDQPLPRKLAAGTTATLSGTLPQVFSKPRVDVVDPIGTMTKQPAQSGQSVKAELKCGDHPGKFLVQVVAEKEGSEGVVTNFPVYCNADAPLAAKMPAASKGPVDPAAAEKQLVDLVNNDRQSAGVKPLNSMPALGKIARDIAEMRAAGKGFSGADLTKALKDADIAAPMLLESMVQGFGVDDLYERLSESPSDRSNTMNPDVTDLGVGIAKGPVIDNKPTYIAAELFVKQRPPVDAAAVKTKLYAAIDKKRSDARLGALAHDPTLDSVAQKYAEAAAANGGKVDKAKESEIVAPLYKESMTVNQLGGFVPDEQSAVDVAEQPSITGAAKLVGVGVAVGTSPQFGKGSPFVMVFLGSRHEAVKRAPAPKRKK